MPALHSPFPARRIAAYACLLLLVVSFGTPFYWMLTSSFKPDTEIYAYPPTVFPRTLTLENYQNLLSRTDFFAWFRNSALIAAATTVLSVGFGSSAGYALSRLRFWGSETFAHIIFAYMIPPILLLTPLFAIINSLALADRGEALIVIYLAHNLPFSVWLLRSYFLGLSPELESAALVDGATPFQAFYKVMFPLAIPGIISTSIFTFNNAWIEYLFASMLLRSLDRMTLSAGVASLMGETGLYSWGMLMAAGTAITLPVMVMFGILQQRLVSGFTAGAVKG